MSGNATLTIERSSEAMNVPRAVTMNTAPDRGAAVAGSARSTVGEAARVTMAPARDRGSTGHRTAAS